MVFLLELKERAQFAIKICLTRVAQNTQHMPRVYSEEKITQCGTSKPSDEIRV